MNASQTVNAIRALYSLEPASDPPTPMECEETLTLVRADRIMANRYTTAENKRHVQP